MKSARRKLDFDHITEGGRQPDSYFVCTDAANPQEHWPRQDRGSFGVRKSQTEATQTVAQNSARCAIEGDVRFRDRPLASLVKDPTLKVAARDRLPRNPFRLGGSRNDWLCGGGTSRGAPGACGHQAERQQFSNTHGKGVIAPA